MKNTYFSLTLLSLITLFGCTDKKSETAKPEKSAISPSAKTQQSSDKPLVKFDTKLGEILIELYPEKAPATVENFIAYVDSEFYDNTVFHRVVPGFVVQGGGFDGDYNRKQTRAPIKNESNNGLKNATATLSMARTMSPNSATSQFFINLVNNSSLDNQPGRPGYAVFGKVIEGFEFVQAIAAIPRGAVSGHPEAPNEIVSIENAEVVNR